MTEYMFYIALVFGIMLAIAHIPQAIKIYTRQSAKDVSLLTYCILLSGFIVWFIYGITITDYAIMIQFGISSIIAAIIIMMAVKYK